MVLRCWRGCVADGGELPDMNLNSPESLRSWLAIRPVEHRQILRWYWRNRPQWRENIEKAVQE